MQLVYFFSFSVFIEYKWETWSAYLYSIKERLEQCAPKRPYVRSTTRKRLLHNHNSPMDSPHKWSAVGNFMSLLFYKLLDKGWIYRWFMMPLCSCSVRPVFNVLKVLKSYLSKHASTALPCPFFKMYLGLLMVFIILIYVGMSTYWWPGYITL